MQFFSRPVARYALVHRLPVLVYILFLSPCAPAQITTGLQLESIGPTMMSGRVADIAVNPENPEHFYVGYASGGLWETRDNGTTFTPLFEQEAVMTIGDLDVHWASGTIYVGTGEVNSSRSSYAGNGLYRSDDGGQSWTHLGLDETHHIGRVIVDPNDGDRVWVAALGHLYSSNPERGVFLSTDGGRNWQKTLFVNDSTGVVDLLQDPRDPDHLYAASWERERRAWNFRESGPGSGIYESTDGGRSWTDIATEGFPRGAGTGRIGLALGYDGDGKAHLYASLDNYFRREAGEPEEETLTKSMLRDMPADDVLRLKHYLLDDFLRDNGFPEELTGDEARARLGDGRLTPLQLVEYLEDANSLLFDTDVRGFEVYKQGADGRWARTHDDYIDGVYFTYGYYFGQLRVDPGNPDHLYALGMPFVKSKDGGKTWTGANAANVHADHHALWINPDRPGHLILGNDGGVNISYDDGATYRKCNVPPLGQFYAVAVDNHPGGYRVYGGLQDNGTWRGPADYEHDRGWEQNGKYPYDFLFGGDGMQVQVDPRDNATTYLGFQFGNYFRLSPDGSDRTYITPKHSLEERPYRWNWQTPILISPHQPDIFYMGSNFLHRSFNRGDDFQKISPDLTDGGKPGDVPYGTITTISESPRRFGLLAVGTDDGNVWVSRDAGGSWDRVDESLPQDLWVSRVALGKHDENTLYVSLNAYRNDDFSAHLYRSRDLGKTWEDLSGNLPAESVNVVYEDPASDRLLYVGTDHGLYYSLDAGAGFTEVNESLPAVAVHDVVVQPEAGELIVGTHGRSLYRADIKPLRAAAARPDQLVLTVPRNPRYSGRYGADSFFGSTEPEVTFSAWLPPGGAAGEGEMAITSAGGLTLYRRDLSLQPGLNTFPYDLTFDGSRAEDYTEELNGDRGEDKRPLRVKAADNGKFYLRPGTYTVTLSSGQEEVTETMTVK